MLRILVLALALSVVGCATTELDRRAEEIAAGERLIPQLGPGHFNAAELRFQLASLQLEQADAFDAADGGQQTRQLRERALAGLESVLNRYPSYSRLDEVRFWRAQTLSELERWQDAVVAWRALPPQPNKQQTTIAKWRLGQALRQTNHCDEALRSLEGLMFDAAARERCLCLAELGLVQNASCGSKP